MITKEEFIDFIEVHEKFNNDIDLLYDLKIDIINSFLFEAFGKVCDMLLNAAFTPDGVDWINWWLYEGKNLYTEERLPVYINDEKVLIETPDELWEIIKDYRI